MKHVSILITFYFTICLCSASFTQGQAQIPIGIKGGLVINEITFRKPNPENSGPWAYESLPSVHLGFFRKVKISESFDFIPEFQFVQKNSRLRTFANYSENIRLSYLDLPLIVSYSPIRWISVDAGASASINIEDHSMANRYNSFDGGLIGGLRFNITEEFSIIGRYYYGLTPIGSITFGRGALPSVDYDAYNQNIQFSLTYYLNKNIKSK